MIKKITNKGFTLAEALVAMLLVAVIAAGIISALMSTKRAIIAPSNKEDMIFAVERASSLLQMADADTAEICNDSAETKALDETPSCNTATGENCHNLNCLRPATCRGNSDFFVYNVSQYDPTDPADTKKAINFIIRCEGQSI